MKTAHAARASGIHVFMTIPCFKDRFWVQIWRYLPRPDPATATRVNQLQVSETRLILHRCPIFKYPDIRSLKCPFC
jgi:hypothetical protein